MSDLIFYTNPQSRGRIVRWMLEELAVPYQTEVVQYGPQMKTPPYTDINPMGKVPAIVHKGKVVTECAGIIAYLADAFPQAGLAPPLDQRQDYYRWLFFAAGPVEQAVTNNALGFAAGEEKQRMVGYGSFEQTLETLAKAVSAHAFIAGDSFSAADVYVGSQINYGLTFGTMPERPGFRDYLNRILSRPAYAKANELDNALMKQPA